MKPLPAALTVAATALDRLRMSLAVKLLLVPPAVVRQIKQQPTLTPHPVRRACRTRILEPERRPPVDHPLGDPPTGFPQRAKTSHEAKSGSRLRNDANADTSQLPSWPADKAYRFIGLQDEPPQYAPASNNQPRGLLVFSGMVRPAPACKRCKLQVSRATQS